MKKAFSLLLLLYLLFTFSFVFISKSSSDEFTDITKQIDDLNNALNQSVKATQPLESQLNAMRTQIKQIKDRIGTIEQDIQIKKKNIDDGYKNLAKQQAILDITIREYYIKSYYNSPILIFLSSSSASDITQLLAYHRATTNRDKAIIMNIALLVGDLENRKKTLENEEVRLTTAKAGLDEQSAKLDKIISGAKDYQSKLSGQIAQLSAQQQNLLAQKLGSLNIPRSAGSGGACSSDIEPFKSPGFSQAFGFFTYGVPNRVGLNQYGAFGRAKAGKLVEEILSTYYENYELKKDYNQEIVINVEGGPSLKIDEYLKHLGEMPESWGNQGGFEALKAQAVAARSYALAYTNNGSGSICGTDHCQVFLANEKGGKWNEAVEATKGWVMTQGGTPIKSWFSSTHGGYIHSSADIGWDSTSWTKNAKDTSTDSISSFTDLKSNAYDKESPWFYCDWGSRPEYNKTAWLKSEEVADIANVILLVRKDSSKKCFVYQPDKPPPAPNASQGCPATDNWSPDKVRQELGGEAMNTATSVEITGVDWNSGKTTGIKINGIPFDGNEFKNYFNLRAPANIQIVGPLYNIEQR
ncbi:MAG: hypothetical protein COY68_00815 [Candidatus Levybacteria bacterium CG_4_10_14_0_8_um_filter_35_23]|nr:MAG: hypothetical protein COY68_00815 [Candidatus Levybacteria bacterium CG_4_10_14_0_8_um_filter_35_23]